MPTSCAVALEEVSEKRGKLSGQKSTGGEVVVPGCVGLRGRFRAKIS